MALGIQWHLKGRKIDTFFCLSVDCSVLLWNRQFKSSVNGQDSKIHTLLNVSLCVVRFGKGVHFSSFSIFSAPRVKKNIENLFSLCKTVFFLIPWIRWNRGTLNLLVALECMAAFTQCCCSRLSSHKGR